MARLHEAPSAEAVEEIHSYIAIRDGLLKEAENARSESKLRSVDVANNVVASCLQPARTTYAAQCLPEAEAARERNRCELVRKRIAELRSFPTRRAA